VINSSFASCKIAYMKHNGFTLIELMIVVAIIGILAAVGIPQYQNYVARAQVSEGLTLASGAKIAVAEYFSTNGTFPADNTEAGLSDAGTITGNYVESVTVSVADGKALITALFSDTDAHSKLQGGEMTLTAVDHGGSIDFACSSSGSTDIASYLPSSCRDLTSPTMAAPQQTDVDSAPVAAGPVLWASLSEEDKVGKPACWDVSVAASADDGNGWVQGENTFSGDHQDVLRRMADAGAVNLFYPTIANPLLLCSDGEG